MNVVIKHYMPAVICHLSCLFKEFKDLTDCMRTDLKHQKLHFSDKISIRFQLLMAKYVIILKIRDLFSKINKKTLIFVEDRSRFFVGINFESLKQ